jgi:hypothetical protein
MGILIGVCITTGLIVAHSYALNLLFTRPISSSYWLMLLASYLAGFAAGAFCGYYAEYSITPSLIAFSAPIPAGFFHLEDGEWIDFPTPAPGVIAFFNLIIVMLSIPLPIIGCLLWHWRKVKALKTSSN